MRTLLSVILLLAQYVAVAQFAPQAGIAGSTAIHAGSSSISGWATECTVQRGYIDIANKALGNVGAGLSSAGAGAANGTIVCLGDSGIAVLRFDAAIYNGPGADFAVFENGFKDPADTAMAFLELAFVEVSSDGTNYFRFPATSNTSTNTQIPGSGVYMDATLINNLAGKYVSSYGTPFDLDELAGTSGLDVNNITHVRLVDVVGSVTGYSSTDKEGKIINDPYPTNFHTGGFDLDAVAAIHSNSTGIAMHSSNIAAGVYPNPATDKIILTLTGNNTDELHATLTTITGTTLLQTEINDHTATISVAQYPAGIYYLTISDANETKWAGKVLKY